MDFTNEVSTAVRLCDGAIVVVDVIEGICSQTKATLRQTWLERIKPILVFNKIDRLIIEKKLTPLDAYIHLQQLLEQINAFVGELFTADVFLELSKTQREEEKNQQQLEANAPQCYDWSVGMEDKDDSNLYFQPEMNNVIFASALDGWGFTISSFSHCLAEKLKISERALCKTLWGDYYINMKQKMILKGAQIKAKKPLFVSMVLENIWSVYDAVLVRKDPVQTEKILSSLRINLSKRDLNSTDAKLKLQSIFSQWLPLSENVLHSVCKLLPSPKDLGEERIERFMCSNLTRFDSLPEKTQCLKRAFQACSSDAESPKIICVSKMISVERKNLPENKHRPLTIEEISQRRELVKSRTTESINQLTGQFSSLYDLKAHANGQPIPAESLNEEDETEEESPVEDNVFIAFSRVFSGKVSKGDELYVLGPKHNPSKIDEATLEIGENLSQLSGDQHVTKARIEAVYLLMGRELEEVDSASAGNIVGLKGLDHHILRTATVSSDLYCPPFIDLHSGSQPILRVAVEPRNPIEMPKLIRGLKLLNQADPCVEVKQQNTGENVIITTGEVHLQRCVDDLVERFACIEINVSDPIVPFRETVVQKPKLDMVNEAIVSTTSEQSNEIITIQTQNKKCTIRLRAVPLPKSVTKLLEANASITKFILNRNEGSMKAATKNLFDEVRTFREQLNEAFELDDQQQGGKQSVWKRNAADFIWSIGSKTCPTNLLLNYDPAYRGKSFFELDASAETAAAPDTGLDAKSKSFFDNYASNFISGFQMASASGPLCEEPMMGVGFIALEWTWVEDEQSSSSAFETFGPISGQIMSTVKEGCKRAFQAQPQRLCSPMFSCTIQVSADVLGRMYGVIGKRHGRILSEEMQEGSQTFIVTSVIPVIESFQFANEIRKQTSGMAVPQLVFSHWEVGCLVD